MMKEKRERRDPVDLKLRFEDLNETSTSTFLKITHIIVSLYIEFPEASANGTVQTPVNDIA